MVRERYPHSDLNCTSNITRIIEQKKQMKEMQIYKNIDNKPVSGYISTNDLMELQKLK